jgi:hypothetical protein
MLYLQVGSSTGPSRSALGQTRERDSLRTSALRRLHRIQAPLAKRTASPHSHFSEAIVAIVPEPASESATFRSPGPGCGNESCAAAAPSDSAQANDPLYVPRREPCIRRVARLSERLGRVTDSARSPRTIAFSSRTAPSRTIELATRRSRRSGAPGAVPDDRYCPWGAHGAGARAAAFVRERSRATALWTSPA